MGNEGSDPGGYPFAGFGGDHRRRYFWHWDNAQVATLLEECVKELQERGVLVELAGVTAPELLS